MIAKDFYGVASMNAITFDTHAYIKRLTMVGMPEAQAEVLADEQAKVIEHQVATKTDVVHIRNDIELVRKEIELVRKDIELVKSELNYSLTIRMGAMIVALGGFLTAIRYFGH